MAHGAEIGIDAGQESGDFVAVGPVVVGDGIVPRDAVVAAALRPVGDIRSPRLDDRPDVLDPIIARLQVDFARMKLK